MGNSQAAPSDPRLATAMRSFTKSELDDLKSLFKSLAVQAQNDGKFVTPSVFQAYFGIHEPLGSRLFDLVTQKRNDGKLTFEDLVIAKAVYEKGSPREIEDFIYQLVDVNGDDMVGRSDLEAVLTSVLSAIFSSSNAENGVVSCHEVFDAFLNAATFSKKIEGCAETSMSMEDFRIWCNLLPSLRKFLGGLMMPPDPGNLGSHIPHLSYPEHVNSDLVILRKEYAWHIGGALSQDQLEAWKLLYHSSINGLSFNTFFGSITAEDGPTILLIKDKEGYVYGGYASQPWDRRSDFYGDMKSFLFQLYPRASIFRPTGANHNLQWCAVNFSSASIPNGIGFGGQVNHFGLFLSESFDHGHTFRIATCLIWSGLRILVNELNVWCLWSATSEYEITVQQSGLECIPNSVLCFYRYPFDLYLVTTYGFYYLVRVDGIDS
ncbi:hypothetical protein H6P81_007920 [Aristolochia fimbriata]|uniref:TLDc domain-containing protein n=1 Tax=Aristolochia fimbriata TaxID=158543 RepID=A0AAV7F2U5_ARIFI|nr:hypothetical protein H6P81_007920 [Aristolochia fimbriata]